MQYNEGFRIVFMYSQSLFTNLNVRNTFKLKVFPFFYPVRQELAGHLRLLVGGTRVLEGQFCEKDRTRNKQRNLKPGEVSLGVQNYLCPPCSL